MANRLTDTEKWKRENFQELSPAMKLASFYVYDNCDHCGIWHPNFTLMSFQIKLEIRREEFFECFKDKIVPLPNGALWFPSFIDFQYKGKLNPKNKAHYAVIEKMRKFGIDLLSNTKGLASPFEGASKPPLETSHGRSKDQDQEKELEKEKEKKGSAEGKQQTGALPEFQDVSGFEILDTVSHRGQNAWVKAYGVELIRSELPKAFAHWESDDARRWQGDVVRFLRNWFKNASEGKFKAPSRVPDINWDNVFAKDGPEGVDDG